jgi:hypothetical protein
LFHQYPPGVRLIEIKKKGGENARKKEEEERTAKQNNLCFCVWKMKSQELG